METSPREKHTALTAYLAEIRDHPLLNRDQEASILRRHRAGRNDALDELVRNNLRFVVNVAREYQNLGLQLEDLINEGNLGLIKAARNYDAGKGTKFVTYAIWWVRKFILRALANHASVVRISTYQQKQVRRIREAERALRVALGRTPRTEEVSEHLARTPARIDVLRRRNVIEVSLDAQVGDDGRRRLSDCLRDEAGENPEDELLRREADRLLEEAITQLDDRERRVIESRYGFSREAPLTLKEIGRNLGLSKERVRQIEIDAKKRLRRILTRRMSRPLAGSKAPNRAARDEPRSRLFPVHPGSGEPRQDHLDEPSDSPRDQHAPGEQPQQVVAEQRRHVAPRPEHRGDDGRRLRTGSETHAAECVEERQNESHEEAHDDGNDEGAGRHLHG